MRKALVYALMDPRDNHLFYYIGGTVQGLEKRLKQHIALSMRKGIEYPLPVSRWIKSLINKGLVPKIELLCICDTENYVKDETAWIVFCWGNGHPLKNVVFGGTPGNRTVKSLLTRERISKAKTGKKASDETRAKMSESAKKKPPRTKETARKLSEALTGVPHTPERVEANRQSHLGLKHTEEAKAKMVESRKNISKETRLKMSISQTGRQTSEETKVKQSLARKLYWEKRRCLVSTQK